MVFLPYILPQPALRPYVKHFMVLHLKLHDVPAHLRIKPYPPDADQMLYFYPRSEVKVIVNNNGDVRSSPGSIFVGQQTDRINLQFGEDHLIIQACLQPGFLHLFLDKMPMKLFNSKELDAESVSDADMKFLNEQLQEETDYYRMVAHIEAYLLNKLKRKKIEYQPIDQVIGFLKITKKAVSLDWLADQACLSPRQFERKFQERMGVSPKFYARIVRFDKAFKMKLQQPQLDWLDVAYRCGYFDYAHMMRDFREFAEVTPSMLLAQDSVSPDRQRF